MPRWFMCLCRWSHLHRVKEYYRDQRRFAYIPLGRGTQDNGSELVNSGSSPARDTVETLEPRLLFSGSFFSYDSIEATAVASSLDRDIVVDTAELDRAFSSDVLASIAPLHDFSADEADANVPQDRLPVNGAVTGTGTILFRLTDIATTSRSTVLFEHEMFGAGSDQLVATLSMQRNGMASLQFHIAPTSGRRISLGGIRFDTRDLPTFNPVIGVSWSDVAARIYVNGEEASTTRVAANAFQQGRDAARGSVASVSARPINVRDTARVSGLMFYSSALLDSQVRAISENILAQRNPTTSAFADLSVPNLSFGQISARSGAVSSSGGATTLVEGDGLVTEYSYNVTVAPGMSALTLRYTGLLFDMNPAPGTTDAPTGGPVNLVRDAFEIALLDANGNSVVPTIGEGRDAFFNITEGADTGLQLDAILASGVGHDANTGIIGVDVTGLEGQSLTVVVRLLNNDNDDETEVTITETTAAYNVLWGVDEDNGHLYAVWDYNNPITSMVNYGPLMLAGVPIVESTDSIAVDSSGVDFMVINGDVGATTGPVLISIDTTTLVPGQPANVQVIGSVSIGSVSGSNKITGLDFHPTTGDLYATHHTGGSSSVDRLLILDTTDASIQQVVGDFDASTPPAGTITLEAESGTVVSPVNIYSDSSASGGQYIRVSGGNNAHKIPPSAGGVTLSFTAQQSGDHHIWGSVIAPGTSDDSFWVSVDGGAFVSWNGLAYSQPLNDWTWKFVYDASQPGSATPLVFNWQAGTSHTVEFRYREDGAKLDQVMIVPDLQYSPAAESLDYVEDLTFTATGELVVFDRNLDQLFLVDPLNGSILGLFDDDTFSNAEGLAFDTFTNKALLTGGSIDLSQTVGEGTSTNADAFQFSLLGIGDAEGVDFHTTTMPMPQRASIFATDEATGQLGAIWNLDYADDSSGAFGTLFIADPTQAGTALTLAGVEPIAVDTDGIAYLVHSHEIQGTNGVAYTGPMLLSFDLNQAKDGAPIFVNYVGQIPVDDPAHDEVPALAFHPITGDLYATVDSRQLGVLSLLVKLDPSDGSIIETIGEIRDANLSTDAILIEAETGDLIAPTGGGTLRLSVEDDGFDDDAGDNNTDGVDDDPASLGEFVLSSWSTNSYSGPNDPVDTGTLSISFTPDTTDVYNIWGRVQAPNADEDNPDNTQTPDKNDSFWVRVDGGAWMEWNGWAATDGWQWNVLYESIPNTPSTPLTFNFTGGTEYTIEFKLRESGTKLDQILVTPDQTLTLDRELFNQGASTRAMAFSEDGNTLYVTSRTYGRHVLWEVDPTTAEVTGEPDSDVFGGLSNGSNGFIAGLGIDPISGNLIASDGVSGGGSTLSRGLEITQTTGGNQERFDFAELGFTEVEGMTVLPHIDPDPVSGGTLTAPPLTGPENLVADPNPGHSAPIDFEALRDVTSGFDVAYGTTTFDANAGVMSISITLEKSSALQVRGNLLLALEGISAPGTVWLDADGQTPTVLGVIDLGVPFLEITHLLERDADGFFVNGLAGTTLTLRFASTGEERFDYNLRLLGELNQAPQFTTTPYLPGAQVVTVRDGNLYQYAAHADDPDGDIVSYLLADGAPTGLAIDSSTGLVTWDTAQAGVDEGAYLFTIIAEDGFGGSATQLVQVQIRNTPGNLPPQFQTDPVTVAYSGVEYVYDADATDPESDALTFSSLSDPGTTEIPFTINTTSGVVSWTPDDSLIGQTVSVTLQVADGQGGFDTQAYDILVLEGSEPYQAGDPDLAISTVDVSGAYYDAQRLTIEGVVTAQIENLGDGSVNDPFSVLFFEDLDFNQAYTPGVDNVLGETVVNQVLSSGVTFSVAAELFGTAAFAGAPVWAYVDSGQVINESDETNNLDNSGSGCDLAALTLPTLTFSVADMPLQPGGGFHFHSDTAGSFGNPPKLAEVGGFASSEAVRGLSEFDITGLGGTAELSFEVERLSGLFPVGNPNPLDPGTIISIDTYIGNGVEDVSDFDAVSIGTIESFDVAGLNVGSTLTFDLAPALANAVANGVQWLGVRLQVLPEVRGDQAITFHQFSVTTSGGPAPDLIPSYLRIEESGGQTTYTARIGNAGATFAPAGVEVSLYDGDPSSGGTLLGTVATTGQLDPGQYEDISLTLSGSPVTDLWVVADDDGLGEGAVQECHEDNNAYSLNSGNTPLPLNTEPTITSTPVISVQPNDMYQYDVDATDPDTGQRLIFDLLIAPDGMTIEADTGLITWAPGTTELGTYQIVARVRDGFGGTALDSFVLNVSNTAPVIGDAQFPSAAVGTSYSHDFLITDADGDDLAYAILAGEQAGMTFVNGVLSWTSPALPQNGITHDLLLRVSDDAGGHVDWAVSLPVFDPANNQLPDILSKDPVTNIATARTRVGINTLFQHQVVAIDTNGDLLTYSLAGAPTGMSIDSTGLITWVPTSADLDTANNGADKTYNFSVEVSDDNGLTVGDTALYTLTVMREFINGIPTIDSLPSPQATLDSVYVYQGLATDPDNDPLLWSLVDGPDGASIDPVTGLLRWQPVVEQLGAHSFTVQVTDPYGASRSLAFPVTVSATNLLPRLVFSAATQVETGGSYEFVVTASDAEEDTIYFDVQGPAGMTYTAEGTNTWRVQWTGGAGAIGSYPISINVSDDAGFASDRTDSQSFTLQVVSSADNRLPELVDINRTPGPDPFEPGSDSILVLPVSADDQDPALVYTYAVEFADLDGDTLTYTLNSPGLTIAADPANPANGEVGWVVDSNNANIVIVTWKPTEAQHGQSHLINVVASDGGGTLSVPIGATVRSDNAAPSIASIASQQVAVGGSLGVIVDADDADNDSLSYALETGPTSDDPEALGLTIDETGRVIWTPTSAQIGSYTFTVRATDPFGATATADFVVQVVSDTIAPTVLVTSSNANPAVGETVTLTVNAADDAQVAAIWLEINGTEVTLDNAGLAVYTALNSTPINVTGYAQDASGNQGSSAITLTPFDYSAAVPSLTIDSPTTNQAVAGRVEIVGSITDADFASGGTVHYRALLTNSDTGAVTDLGQLSTTSAINSGGLGLFVDATLLANGQYTLRVQASDVANIGTAPSSLVRTVERNVDVDSGFLKLGNFGMRFTDLSVNVGGLPLVIQRTYDTLDAGAVRDFGYGWTMNFQQAEVETTGLGSRDAFTDNTVVTIELPDGSSHDFAFTPVSAGFLSPYYVPQFTNISGTGASLERVREVILPRPQPVNHEVDHR